MERYAQRGEKKHYDKVAESYSRMITSGVGGAMKRQEICCLMNLLSPRKGESVLDVGCGSGFYGKLIDQAGAKVLCVDISSKMIDIVRNAGLDAEVRNVESLELGRRFDKILCAGPLEFCRQPANALVNLRRHLHSDGYLVLSALNVSIIGFGYYLYHFSHGLRITLFSLKHIATLLMRAGFKIDIVKKPTSFLYVIRATPS